jgi:hypothetical protein
MKLDKNTGRIKLRRFQVLAGTSVYRAAFWDAAPWNLVETDI